MEYGQVNSINYVTFHLFTLIPGMCTKGVSSFP